MSALVFFKNAACANSLITFYIPRCKSTFIFEAILKVETDCLHCFGTLLLLEGLRDTLLRFVFVVTR
jgi:hypothetical protein